MEIHTRKKCGTHFEPGNTLSRARRQNFVRKSSQGRSSAVCNSIFDRPSAESTAATHPQSPISGSLTKPTRFQIAGPDSFSPHHFLRQPSVHLLGHLAGGHVVCYNNSGWGKQAQSETLRVRRTDASVIHMEKKNVALRRRQAVEQGSQRPPAGYHETLAAAAAAGKDSFRWKNSRGEEQLYRKNGGCTNSMMQFHLRQTLRREHCRYPSTIPSFWVTDKANTFPKCGTRFIFTTSLSPPAVGSSPRSFGWRARSLLQQ